MLQKKVNGKTLSYRDLEIISSGNTVFFLHEQSELITVILLNQVLFLFSSWS